MARAPFQVLIVPYRIRTIGMMEVAVFHRHDESMWQFLSGGGEDGESPTDAAQREVREEAGLSANLPLMKLESMATIPRSEFPGGEHWPNSIYVVPEHCFAADLTQHEISLSEEHKAFEWLLYEDARHKLTWDSNRNALWELRERLSRSPG